MSIQSTFEPSTRISSGRKRPSLINPQISLGEACLRLMSRNPNHIVQINADSGVQCTNEDVQKRAIRVVQFYERHGIKRDDVIGLAAGNSPNTSAIVLASFISGIPFNSLDPSFEKSDVVHMFGITRPKLVFCDEVNYMAIRSALTELNLNSSIFIVDGNVLNVPKISEFIETNEESWKDFICPDLGNQYETPAAILCSSGTTGMPKAVVLSQASLQACSRNMITTCDDIFLNFSTMYWISGVWTLLVSLLNGNTKVISAKTFKAADALRIIETYKITHFQSSPVHMAQLLQEPDLSSEKLVSLRKYYVGGSMVPANFVSKMSAYLKNGTVFAMYGMTELGSMCSINGILFDNIQVRIVNETGTNQDKGIEGEILVRSPHSFLRYFGNVEQTRVTLDEAGWIRSGDIGYFDVSGHLIVSGRKKDILKYAMFHYTPSDIERVILQMDGVAEVCVCGVSDGLCNDLPAALVKRSDGSTISEEDILSLTSNHLVDYKHLRGGVYFTDSIPMTVSGKHQRNKVKAICEELYKRKN